MSGTVPHEFARELRSASRPELSTRLLRALLIPDGRTADLVEPRIPWEAPAMSTLATTDPEELRPLLRERIEHATDEELEAVRKALLLFEARRLAEEIGREFDEDWRSGKITEEKIAQAIQEHRARHPYR